MKQNAGILFHEVTMEITARGAYDTEGKRKYLSREEGLKFLRQARLLPKERALFCLTLYYTGCRISEALGLRQSDIDDEMKVILVRTLKKRGRRVIRRIPVPKFLIDELLELAVAQVDQLIWRFSRVTGWRIIKSVMKNAQIIGIHATTKGLRHGFGVRGALVQIPVSLLQNWMGHSDPSTTAIYLDVKDEEERKLIERTWK
jgi:integrase/recombinase XerD